MKSLRNIAMITAAAVGLYAEHLYVANNDAYAAEATGAKVSTHRAAGKGSKGKAAGGKSKAHPSSLEQRLTGVEQKYVTLAEDVTKVNQNYDALNARVNELTKPENTYLNDTFKSALGEKFGELETAKKAIGTECTASYKAYVALAEDVSNTFGAPDLVEKVVELGKDPTATMFERTLAARLIFDDEASLPAATTEYAAAIQAGVESVKAQHDKCFAAASQYAALGAKLNLTLSRNLRRTEAEDRAAIESAIRELVPGMIPKSPWNITALGGILAIHTRDGSEALGGAVSAQLCYAMTPTWNICAEGTVFQHTSAQSSDAPSTVNSKSTVGPGYTQDSTTTTKQARSTEYANAVGLHLSYQAMDKGSLGLSLHEYNGEQATTTDRTRSVGLFNSAGTALGNPSSVSDRVVTRSNVNAVVPQFDITYHLGDHFTLRGDVGYDMPNHNLLLMVRLGYKF